MRDAEHEQAREETTTTAKRDTKKNENEKVVYWTKFWGQFTTIWLKKSKTENNFTNITASENLIY